MFNREQIKENPYFKRQSLNKDELLFDEGEKDSHLYIIESGSLKIEKYLTDERQESKILAVLHNGAIFGEGSLSNNDAKEVKISATEKTDIFKIHQKDFEKFMKEYPKIGIELLSSIIEVSNKRLLESNFLLTSNYKMSKTISEKTVFSNKSLFDIIEELKDLLEITYIVFIERNPVLENYIKIEYDTRTPGKMQDMIIELDNFSLDILPKNNIPLAKYNYIQELINKNTNAGYLIFGNENSDFNDTHKKVISSISAMIAGFIRQKQLFDEEQNKTISY